jgi:hypothetical protein
MPRQLITIPRNLSAVITRVLYVDAAGTSQVVDLSAALGAQPMEANRPVRQFFAWPGKRNYEGLWWSSTTRSMIAFESLLERQALTVFDHDPAVVAISAQPFALLWPRSTTGPTFHIPDFFLRLADGSGCVIDVRPASRIDRSAEEQFTRSRSETARAGLDYKIFSGLEQPALATLTFLAGYRFDRCRPAASLTHQLVARFAEPTPLGRGADAIATGQGMLFSEILVGLYFLLWHQQLRLDLTQPLTLGSAVWA